MRANSKIWFLLLVLGTLSLNVHAAELRFCLHGEPKTFDPLLIDDDPSETIRYLTGGVLVRVNRNTQALEPELATAWKVSKDARTITFTLREPVYFSDGTPFSAEDVAFELKLRLEGQIVLDDAVVHDNHVAFAIAVRVGILFSRPPVRGPAGVADSEGALHRVHADGFFETAQLALGAANG